MISKEHLILLNTHQIFHYMHKNIVVYILSIFSIFLALNSYLHFFAFMCVYFSLYCLISNQLKVHFVFKTLSPKNALDNGRFSFQTNSEI